jgi:ferrous iron transport protein A
MPFESPIPTAEAPAPRDATLPLGSAGKGFRGVVRQVGAAGAAGTGLTADELERRLLEIGFIEGAVIEIVHEGLIGRDPIAIRINETTVALRRREANAILVEAQG